MKILFPSEPFSPKEVDSSFKAEFEAARLVGFDAFLFDHDEFTKKDNLSTNLPMNEKEGEEKIILRSWMLKEEQYMSLFGRLYGRGYTMINTPGEYLNCHYLPNVFAKISANSSKAWWTEGWDKIENKEKVDWKSVRDYLGGDVLIKDYVKSEKGNPDLFILGKELTNEEFYNKTVQFVEARGKLFNKGIVLKSVETLKKYDGKTNEWRFFFLNKKMFDFDLNSEDLQAVNQPIGQLTELMSIAKTIDSNFFTIDVAEKEDGSWMILEAGDGQVSGLSVSQKPIKFYNALNRALTENE